jgi:transposase
MWLKPTAIEPIPAATAQVARAALPRGNVSRILRDALGTIFTDADFGDLYPDRGQSGLPPWRLALVTVLQFREHHSDRQAAEAVRARIDWQDLLGSELTDPGFDYSVLSEFRARLSTGDASEHLLETLQTHGQGQGLLRPGEYPLAAGGACCRAESRSLGGLAHAPTAGPDSCVTVCWACGVRASFANSIPKLRQITGHKGKSTRKMPYNIANH